MQDNHGEIMNTHSYTIIANWKMYLLPEQAVAFIEQNFKELSDLSSTKTKQLVLCPSFEAVFMVKQAAEDIPLSVGAQDCSTHQPGAYTGQIAAESLKQLGCTYCIVGHSETREYQRQTSTHIAEKMIALLNNNITPIVCCGENTQERNQNKTEQVLHEQLTPVFAELKKRTAPKKIIIAYEPLWAIGSGVAAQKEQIEHACSTITHLAEKQQCAGAFSLVYGGSITASTVPPLKTITQLDGFLVGKASTDFQELKKIVDCL